MAQHGNKLLAQLGGFTFQKQRGFGALLVFFGVHLQRDQSGERLQRGLDGAAFKLRGFRVQRADGAEKSAVGTEYRHRDVAFETVQLGGVMVLVVRVCTDVIDNDRLMRPHAFKAQGGGQIQFAAGF